MTLSGSSWRRSAEAALPTIPHPEESTKSAAAATAAAVRRGRLDVFECPMPDDATRIWKVRRPDLQVPWHDNSHQPDRIEEWAG
ncbi:hypothetical protein Pta02_16110 [Planobispora takensis]|uniref:Uncharacterized protein n=1 Tax=Planobispora takensis TaxID=1367882 RepID=A0A8J3WSS9_9ACTN|nr:hypothetical protein Pta02_16110 [Planobispora takensis]